MEASSSEMQRFLESSSVSPCQKISVPNKRFRNIAYIVISSSDTGDRTHNLKVTGSNPVPATKLYLIPIGHDISRLGPSVLGENTTLHGRSPGGARQHAAYPRRRLK